MGLMSLFTKATPSLLHLPLGSFTIDRDGFIVIGTLPSSFPRELIMDIGRQVLAAFREANEAQLPLSDLIINYPSLRITARELRGGAFIFLAPLTPANNN